MYLTSLLLDLQGVTLTDLQEAEKTIKTEENKEKEKKEEEDKEAKQKRVEEGVRIFESEDLRLFSVCSASPQFPRSIEQHA